MSRSGKLFLVLYLVGILIIYSGYELGRRGVSEIYAGMVLIPLYGIVSGYIELLLKGGGQSRETGRLFIALFVAGIFITMTIILEKSGVSFYWTGLPALAVTLAVMYRLSKKAGRGDT
ncbi:MAG: hypothetical protein KAV42_03405 [Candidatus Krumholzibacteria bacterium]|nr:hypothetical protein [Candidatus Krumholzibacteria bacterium]